MKQMEEKQIEEGSLTILFKLTSPLGSSEDWTEKQVESEDPLYPYTEFLLNIKGFDRLICGARNFDLFAELARPISQSNEVIEELPKLVLARKMKEILSECTWLGKQNSVVELYKGKEDKDPVIRVTRCRLIN